MDKNSSESDHRRDPESRQTEYLQINLAKDVVDVENSRTISNQVQFLTTITRIMTLLLFISSMVFVFLIILSNCRGYQANESHTIEALKLISNVDSEQEETTKIPVTIFMENMENTNVPIPYDNRRKRSFAPETKCTFNSQSKYCKNLFSDIQNLHNDLDSYIKNSFGDILPNAPSSTQPAKAESTKSFVDIAKFKKFGRGGRSLKDDVADDESLVTEFASISLEHIDLNFNDTTESNKSRASDKKNHTVTNPLTEKDQFDRDEISTSNRIVSVHTNHFPNKNFNDNTDLASVISENMKSASQIIFSSNTPQQLPQQLCYIFQQPAPQPYFGPAPLGDIVFPPSTPEYINHQGLSPRANDVAGYGISQTVPMIPLQSYFTYQNPNAQWSPNPLSKFNAFQQPNNQPPQSYWVCPLNNPQHTSEGPFGSDLTSNSNVTPDSSYGHHRKYDENSISSQYRSVESILNKIYGRHEFEDSYRDSSCHSDSVKCMSNGKCLDPFQWCDGVIDCNDGSDEGHCPCKSRLHESRLCDGFYDCPLGEDELGCFKCGNFSFNCNEWSRKKPMSNCFEIHERCDDFQHCFNNKDEKDCIMLHPEVDHHDPFGPSHLKGFLHKNFKGKWYPVCETPLQWPREVCMAETGSNDIPQVELKKTHMFRGKFMKINFHGGIELIDHCFGGVVYVTCAPLKCGIKNDIMGLNPRETEDELPDDELIARRKREIELVPTVEVGGMDYDENDQYPPLSYMEEHWYFDDHYSDSGVYTIVENPQPLLDSTYEMPSEYFHNFKYIEYDQYGIETYDHPDIYPNNFHLYDSFPLTSPRREDTGYYTVFGTRDKRGKGRVVGGRPSAPASWPWLVAISRNGKFHCGGSLINDNWVLSAAHCVVKYWNYYYEIRAGMLRRLSFSSHEQTRFVIKIISHHLYERSTMINDLSLMKMNEPIIMNKWVRPSCLPSLETAGEDWLWGPQPGVMCTAVGWGATYEHGPDPDHLREVEVPIIKTCKHAEDRKGQEICAGRPEGGRDACQGDSGGPLLCKNSNNPKQWFIAGIVSHGEGCAREREDGVYTRVSIFLDWIADNTNDRNSLKLIRTPKMRCPGFPCVHGVKRCLQKKSRCDGTIDCLGGEDEVNCHREDIVGLAIDEPESDSIEDDSSSNVTEITSDNSHRSAEETTSNENKPSFEMPEKESVEVTEKNLFGKEVKGIRLDDDFLLTESTESVTVFEMQKERDSNHEEEMEKENSITDVTESLFKPVSSAGIEEHYDEFNSDIYGSGDDDTYQSHSPKKDSLFEDVPMFDPQAAPNDPKTELEIVTLKNDNVVIEDGTTTLQFLMPSSENDEKNRQAFEESTDAFIELLKLNTSSTFNHTARGDLRNENTTFHLENPKLLNTTRIKNDSLILESRDLPNDEDQTQNNDALHIKNTTNILNVESTTATDENIKEFSSESTISLNLTTAKPSIPLNTDEELSKGKGLDVISDDFNSESNVSKKDLTNNRLFFNSNGELMLPENIQSMEVTGSGTTATFFQRTPPEIFNCQRIPQKISQSKRCDRRPDCEDGTDEINCSCSEYIIHVHPSAICDGHLDCEDDSDEQGCYSCPTSYFLCKISETCIPNQEVCDGIKNCNFGEDEIDCFALYKDEVLYDKDERPHYNTEGIIAMRKGNNWHTVCQETWIKGDKDWAAFKICEYLDFTNFASYNIVRLNPNISTTTESSITLHPENSHRYYKRHTETLHNNIPTLTANNCNALHVKCSSNPSGSSNLYLSLTNKITDVSDSEIYVWPWIAKIHIDGMYECVGVLIDKSWILVESSCMKDIDLATNYVTAVLGTKRLIPDIKGPYEQIIRVDSIKELQFTIMMLHLEHEPQITRYTKVIPLPNFDMHDIDDNDVCVAHGINERGTPQSVFLKPSKIDCGLTNRCFQRESIPPNCQNYAFPDHWSGILFCSREIHQSNQNSIVKTRSWYPAASFNESFGYCGFKGRISLPNLGYRKDDIIIAMKSYTDEHHKEPNCIGARCKLGQCIMPSEVCNGIFDCQEGTDESFEHCKRKTDYCTGSPHDVVCKCSVSEMKCASGQCISKQSFANGYNDCPDGDDEPKVTTCHSYLERTAPYKMCDGIRHCKDKTDEDPKYCNCFAEPSFKCPNAHFCIPYDFICDGDHDCPGGEDEFLCVSLRNYNSTFKEGAGEVILRKYGVWYPKCFEKSKFTKSELEDICSDLGYRNGHAIQFTPPDRIQEPLTHVVKDDFTDVSFGGAVISLRSGNYPYAWPEIIPNTKQCHRLYVECI